MSVREEVVSALEAELVCIADNLDKTLPEDMEELSGISITVNYNRPAIYADGKVICTVDGRTSSSFEVCYHDRLWGNDGNE